VLVGCPSIGSTARLGDGELEGEILADGLTLLETELLGLTEALGL